MNGKQFAVAILLAAVMLTLAFTPIASQQVGTQQVGTYDPWTDINGDGIIDIFDIISVGTTFGTSGDPTKNINVNSLNHFEWWTDVQINPKNYTYFWFSIEGYRQVSLYYWWGLDPFQEIVIEMGRLETQWPGGSYYTTYYQRLTVPPGPINNVYFETLMVQGPNLSLAIFSTLTYVITVRLAVYATC